MYRTDTYSWISAGRVLEVEIVWRWRGSVVCGWRGNNFPENLDGGRLRE